MTTTILTIQNLKGLRRRRTVKSILRKAGYHVIDVLPGKAKISGNSLSLEEVGCLKRRIGNNGFHLVSVCDTTWPEKPQAMA